MAAAARKGRKGSRCSSTVRASWRRCNWFRAVCVCAYPQRCEMACICSGALVFSRRKRRAEYFLPSRAYADLVQKPCSSLDFKFLCCLAYVRYAALFLGIPHKQAFNKQTLRRRECSSAQREGQFVRELLWASLLLEY